jgi:hypothetical protein
MTLNPVLTCVPLRYRAGAVIPYLPLRHLPVVGLASKPYSFLGFRVAPGAEGGFGSVYEDDGYTTAYLDGLYGHTTLQYARASPSSFNAVISPSANSSGIMSQRSYQVAVRRVACDFRTLSSPCPAAAPHPQLPRARHSILLLCKNLCDRPV